MRRRSRQLRGSRPHAVARCLAVATAGLVVACGDATGPIGKAGPSRRNTEVQQYTLQRGVLGWEAVIAFVFTNTADSPVYLDNCNGRTGASFEKLVEGEWVFALGVGRPDCLSPLIEVGAGGTFEADIPFFAAYPENDVDPKLAVAGGVEGRYRIVLYGVYGSATDATYPFGPPIPQKRRTSAAFELLEDG